ncbi:hypothetical protein QC762_0043700 [Podospora pseudocomata]|uniref:2EXR domain-containing protein n=1 Tax=Podospora pseudocomata TaxID=2093779 RepID=A0ABR0GN97_9PEZI|nr:hypothetical protein QC762_0043700 [Podospora pseudocomata]
MTTHHSHHNHHHQNNNNNNNNNHHHHHHHPPSSSDDNPPSLTIEPPLLTWEQLLAHFTQEVHRLSSDLHSSHRRLEASFQSQLSVIKRDLSRQLTREIGGVHSHLLLSTQAPKFSYFRKLPVEVRMKVWEFALWGCPRVLEVRAGYLPRGGQVVGRVRGYHGVFEGGTQGEEGRVGRDWRPRVGGGHQGVGGNGGSNPLPGPVVTTNLLPPPPLAGTCHESRVVCLRHGGLVKTKVVTMDGQAYVTAHTWFSPGVDWLKMPSVGPVFAATIVGSVGQGELPPPLDIQQLAEQVLIRKPQDRAELERQVRRFQIGGLWERLKTVGVVVTCDVVRVRMGGWEWGLGMGPGRELFPAGEGPVRFVDLQSPSSTLSIASLFPPGSPPHQVWTAHHYSLVSKNPFCSPLLNNTTFRLEGLETLWLIYRSKLFPLTFALSEIIDSEDLLFYDGEVTRQENGWVREELKRMPEIKLLHAFIMDEFNEEGGGGGYNGEKGVEVRRLYGGNFGGRLGTLGAV